GVPEELVGEEPTVVLDADELAATDEVRVSEAEPRPADRGHEEEDDEPERRRSDEQQRRPQVALRTPGHPMLCDGHVPLLSSIGSSTGPLSLSTRIRAVWSGSRAGTSTPTRPRTAPGSTAPSGV